MPCCRRLRKLLCCAILVAGIGAAKTSAALEPATPLARLNRQAWTMENGLPQNTVPVLMQSSDGYLWAGTELGLARFDGTAFRIFDHTSMPAFPDAEIRCLLEDAKKGGLWIGTSDGLISWRDGVLKIFNASDGLGSSSIRGLTQTADGTVWVWSDAGLARWSGSAFAAVPTGALPKAEITSIASDGAGGFWVGTENGLASFRNGRWSVNAAEQRDLLHGAGRALVKTMPDGDVLIADARGVLSVHTGFVSSIIPTSDVPEGNVSYLERLADGTIAVATKSTLVLWRQGHVERYTVGDRLPGSRIESLMADREDCLWVGTNHGLTRIYSPARGQAHVVEQFPASDPLAENSVVSLREDEEGDVWAGTETSGLHILRDARFQGIGNAEGLSSDATTAVVEDSLHREWIGTADGGVNCVSLDAANNPRVGSITANQGLISNVVLSLAAGYHGDIWVGTPDGLSRIDSAGVRSYTSADGLPDDFVRSLLVEPDGSVWIGTRRGLTHLVDGRFTTLTQADGLGSDLVGALARTADGDLWIATFHGLSRLHAGKLRNYTTTDGLSSNVITALSVTPDGLIWVGTQNAGLNLWDGQRFLALRASGENSILPQVIHAITPDDRGHLWLASDNGLTRADALFLWSCLRSGHCSEESEHVAHFSTADGLRSREMSSNSHPTSMKSSDGRLWFTTPRGVIVVDPLHFAELPGPPPVAIERFSVDDHESSKTGTLKIGAGAMRFQFDYVGLSFAEPQKVRYRYMLRGFDHSWIDAGLRRTAYYTNIPPGAYRFCVEAALGEGAFVDAGGACELEPHLITPVGTGRWRQASLQFRLVPHYYQTLWFWALAVLATLVLVVLVVRRRVVRVEREFAAVMGERNRIAREIHDTLAQGYVGISLQLEILGQLLRMGKADAAQKHLEQTQGLVREGLDDARQSIWALRSQDSREQNLPIRLRRFVERARDEALTATIRVYGAYRPLVPEVEREVLRIAQEAIHNVKKHAHASRLSVRVEYDARSLTLTVSDNGHGFATEAADGQLNGAGHYGLTGMRERSALIHAELEIASELGQGTTVTLRVPAEGSERGVDDIGMTESSKEQL
ncbi:two-component regulator propeller domain-containing protein [Acidicapsa dinghuensis]|uniref:Two-component regulator propeller domain-containing protein n=1 Tax=Acidicapsa dinghuensis TaxID=2218256 RepID=A0ABW1EGD5_9BACT|nr:sensor histidine kinase [Acidicapsa dinghuensis]